MRLCVARVREPLDWKMSFRSRLAYITRGKINFCAVKFYAATSPLSRLPSYLPSYRSVFLNALEFRQSSALMQNLSTYRGLRRMKFCRSPRDARGIYLLCLRVIDRISLPQVATLLTPIFVGFRLLLRVYFCALQPARHPICVKIAPCL